MAMDESDKYICFFFLTLCSIVVLSVDSKGVGIVVWGGDCHMYADIYQDSNDEGR